jgi:hypothetical protein
MTGFDLPHNFTQVAESLLRRVQTRVVPPQISLSIAESVNITPSTSRTMVLTALKYKIYVVNSCMNT